MVRKHRVSIEHISTDLIIVDPLTKRLPPKHLLVMLRIWALCLLVNDECCY